MKGRARGGERKLEGELEPLLLVLGHRHLAIVRRGL